ncbi:hypothetical protein GGR52DRAFT_571975 [Hypoxylon sp. FL1284]|nr:hypothetical protein GGR52DRAFT_571975 [Hypoxylon sp. FL1284]
MATDRSNLEVVDFSSFSSAALGTLEYDDDTQDWLLTFGHVVAHYEYLRTHADRGLRDPVRLDDIIEVINSTGSKYMSSFKIQDNISVGDCIAQIRRFVKATHKEKSYALFLIAGCSWYLSKSYWLTAESDSRHQKQLKHVACSHLRELTASCPNIAIQEKVLWTKLNQKLRKPHDISTYDIRELLQELCRPLKVLLFSPDPRDAGSTRPGAERRKLMEARCKAAFRDKVNVEDIPSCRVEDIAHELDKHRPDIVQFLGHGDEAGLYFEDGDGRAKLVQIEAFAALLGQYKKTIKLVILNTCYSSRAQCIADEVGCLIGMEGKIRNKDAMAFTASFYGALGDGLTVKESFDRANTSAKLDGTVRFQAHLLEKGQASTTAGAPTRPPPYNDYRGLDSLIT